jgi:hypothetical protein
MPSVVMLDAAIVVMLSVIKKSAIMVRHVELKCHYAECHYAECRGAISTPHNIGFTFPYGLFYKSLLRLHFRRPKQNKLACLF